MELPLTETERQQRTGLEENISRSVLYMLVLDAKKPIHLSLSTLIHLSFPLAIKKKKRDDFSLLLGSHVYILKPIQFHSLRGELKVNRIPEQHVDSLQVKCHPAPNKGVVPFFCLKRANQQRWILFSTFVFFLLLVFLFHLDAQSIDLMLDIMNHSLKSHS